jgi:Holliday junction resolvase RusA-like endonuclease
MRGKKVPQAYYPGSYSKYKEALAFLMLQAEVKPGDYHKLKATFYLPFPVNTPKKRRIEGTPHIKKPDVDNFAKGLMDGLETAKIIQNDSKFYSVHVEKLYTVNKPRIEFKLI